MKPSDPALPTLPNRRSSAEPVRISVWLGWIAAVVLAVVSVFMGGRLITLGTEISLARTQAEIAHAEAQDFRQQLEAEQILSTKQIADLQAARVLADAILFKLTPPPAPLVPSAEAAPAVTPASALLVWHPLNHEGVAWVEHLPLLKSDEQYVLWLAEAFGDWDAAGVLKVDIGGAAKVVFSAADPLVLRRVMITREASGNLPAQPGSAIALSANL